MKVAILSDIHGNSYALRAVLEACKQASVSKLLLLGDYVGYYYYPLDVLDQLSSWDIVMIRGNHEDILARLERKVIDKTLIRNKYGSGHDLALKQLSQEKINMLVNLPQHIKIEIEGCRFSLNHGSPFDADKYLYPDSDEELLSKCDLSVDFVCIGHSHYSFAHRNEKSILLNVGSVGQSREKGGLASWAMIDTENKSFDIIKTPYDVKELLDQVERIDPTVPYLSEILLR